MDKELFYANLNTFSKVLNSHDTNLQAFIFDSQVYVEGIRKSLSQVERYCPKGSRILDLGCGTGFLSLQLASLGFQVNGIDVERSSETISEFATHHNLQANVWRSLETDSVKLEFYDGVNLPFEDQYFDAIVAHAVVEHIPLSVVNHVFQEIYRTLKPGGYFLIFRTPRKQAVMEHVARVLHMGSHDELVGEQELTSMLAAAGLKVVSFNRTDLVFGVLPGKLQGAWNSLSPALLKMDDTLLQTPLNNFAHHMQIISHKPIAENAPTNFGISAI